MKGGYIDRVTQLYRPHRAEEICDRYSLRISPEQIGSNPDRRNAYPFRTNGQLKNEFKINKYDTVTYYLDFAMNIGMKK